MLDVLIDDLSTHKETRRKMVVKQRENSWYSDNSDAHFRSLFPPLWQSRSPLNRGKFPTTWAIVQSMGIRNKSILWIELTKFFKISQASIFPSFAIFLNSLQLPTLENRRSLSMGLRIFRSIFYLVASSFAVSPNFSFSELLLFYEFFN